MGMDGLSIANTGLVKESTSAEYTNKTEQAIHTDDSNTNKQVQSLSQNQKVRSKDDEDKSDKKNNSEKQNLAENNDNNQDSTEDDITDEEIDIEEIENPNKDFYVKLNTKDDIIELYDSSTNKLIETISGNELGELVQKLNMASGIFINKKV